MIATELKPCSRALMTGLQEKINLKTKPQGALGMLEQIALQAGLIQNTLTPELRQPHMIVFAADHGIAAEGVSAYPQEVTAQMVHNFLSGGAAINVFCRQHNIKLTVVDAGVKSELPDHPELINRKIAQGTASFLSGKAMTVEQCNAAMQAGMELAENIAASGSNVIGFGEMGIGNTSSASMLTSIFCNRPLEQCVGRGTGLNDAQWNRKIKVLQKAAALHNLHKEADPVEVLTTFGGFEVAMMAGAMLEAAQRNMIILVDGFITSAAFLAAHALQPNILDYSFFCHQSEEQGHTRLLHYLKVKPILQLGMRLGEGTGVAVAYPVIQSAVNFLSEMASFEQAGVSGKTS